MGKLSDGDTPPPQVQAIEAQVNDQAIAWTLYEDGSYVIIFNQKGKRKFEKADQPPVFARKIDTKAEAEDMAVTMPSHNMSTPKPKRKEK